MSQGSYDDTIKFRAGALKEAAGELDAIHLGGINISELPSGACRYAPSEHD